jgi:hypothetical protein
MVRAVGNLELAGENRMTTVYKLQIDWTLISAILISLCRYITSFKDLEFSGFGATALDLTNIAEEFCSCQIMLVKCSKLSTSRAGSYCQRTSHTKLAILCKT